MSDYSEQVTNVLDGTLVPRMKRLVSSIALIEPYSIDSDDLKERYEELCYLTTIYDYLHEYEIGEEEMSDEYLLSAIRLIGNISINLQPEVFNPASNFQDQGVLFDVLIDGVPFLDGSTVSNGIHNIEVTYNGTCAVTKLIFNQKMVGAPGQTVYMQNAVFDKNGKMDFRAYGNNNILLTSAEIYYTIGNPDTRIANALPTVGLLVTLEM